MLELRVQLPYIGQVLSYYFRTKGKNLLADLVYDFSKSDPDFKTFTKHLALLGVRIAHKKHLQKTYRPTAVVVALLQSHQAFLWEKNQQNSDPSSSKSTNFQGFLTTDGQEFEEVIRSHNELKRHVQDVIEVWTYPISNKIGVSSHKWLPVLGISLYSISYIALAGMFILFTLLYYHTGNLVTRTFVFLWIGFAVLLFVFILSSLLGKFISIAWDRKMFLNNVNDVVSTSLNSEKTMSWKGFMQGIFILSPKSLSSNKTWMYGVSVILIMALFSIHNGYGIFVAIVWLLAGMVHYMRTKIVKKRIPSLIANMLEQKDLINDMDSALTYVGMGSMLAVFLQRIQQFFHQKHITKQYFMHFIYFFVFLLFPMFLISFWAFNESHYHTLTIGGGVSVVILSLLVFLNCIQYLYGTSWSVYLKTLKNLYGVKSYSILSSKKSRHSSAIKNDINHDNPGFFANNTSSETLFSETLLDTSLTSTKMSAPEISVPEISVQNLSVDFQEHEKNTKVLHDISCVIPSKSKVAIIGSVGSGKSTFLRCLVGLVSPSVGDILFDQRTESFRLDTITYVNNQMPVPTSFLKSFFMCYKDVDMVKRWITEFSLQNVFKKDSNWFLLSKGILQLLNILRGVLEYKPILILDDPLRDMDSIMEEKLMKILNETTKDQTVIMTTQKEMLLDMCNHLLILENGSLILQGPKDDVLHLLNEELDDTDAEGNVKQEQKSAQSQVVQSNLKDSIKESTVYAVSQQKMEKPHD